MSRQVDTKNIMQRDSLEMVDWQSCPQTKHDLRAEIDRLRLRTQELHIALEEAHHLRPRLRMAAKVTLKKAQKMLGRFISRVKYGDSLPHEPSAYPDFVPYRVSTPQPAGAPRPRILHFISNFYTGGSAQLVVDLIERLGDEFEQEVVSRRLPARPSYKGVRIHHREKWRNSLEVDKLLQEFQADLVHVHYLADYERSYSRLSWHWYRQIFQALDQHSVPVIENLNIPVEPYVSPAVNCYVHVSEFVKCHFGRLDSHNVTIYPGSDLRFFSRPEDAPFPDDCIGMVCRLERDKLAPESIDVMIEVVRRRETTKVIVVGGGAYLDHYHNRVTEAGLEESFTFTGYVSYDELPRLYRQMSIFVTPVHTESFGQVSPFAMGMALPVVGYHVGALPEIVGDTSLLAPPGDHTKLADIIVELLENRERRLQIGEINRQRAVERFSVEAMIDQYGRLYRELIG